MPEGDTVKRAAQKLDRALRGHVLLSAELRWPSLAANDLTGWQTVEVISRGKHLLHRFDSGYTLHSHLRMEGHWQVRARANARGRIDRPRGRSHELRVKLSTERSDALGWRLGMLDLISTNHEAQLIGHLGPDILGVDWDHFQAIENIRAQPARPIAEALLDQRNLAGIGTMWACEVLFMLRIPPWAPVGELEVDQLGVDQVGAIVERAKLAMTKACDSPITSSTGSIRNGEQTWVHSRSGQPCRRCRGLIRVAMAGIAPTARTIFYCPNCQGGLAHHDDGRPQSPMGSGNARRPPGRKTAYRN